MHDLAGEDPDLRFSPYCWRTRFALAHKGLPVETVPWRFTDRDEIAFVRGETEPLANGDAAPTKRRLAGRVLGRRGVA